MNNRIFMDSSLLIEYRKGTQTDLFEAILSDINWQLCISQTVVSEYLFFHLAIFSGKAPLTVKSSKEINTVLANSAPEDFLAQFDWLTDFEDIGVKAVQFMSRYNLLPNDALIAAICKEYDIKYLASFDPDYIQLCKEEGIQLIQTITDWKSIQII